MWAASLPRPQLKLDPFLRLLLLCRRRPPLALGIRRSLTLGHSLPQVPQPLAPWNSQPPLEEAEAASTSITKRHRCRSRRHDASRPRPFPIQAASTITFISRNNQLYNTNSRNNQLYNTNSNNNNNSNKSQISGLYLADSSRLQWHPVNTINHS